jgi:hypothetical protein
VNISLEVAEQHIFISATGWDRKSSGGVNVGSGEKFAEKWRRVSRVIWIYTVGIMRIQWVCLVEIRMQRR